MQTKRLVLKDNSVRRLRKIFRERNGNCFAKLVIMQSGQAYYRGDYGYPMDNPCFYSMLLCINSQSNMCCSDEWVAWNKKGYFAFLGGFKNDGSVFFFKFPS